MAVIRAGVGGGAGRKGSSSASPRDSGSRAWAHQEEALRRGVAMAVTQAYLDRQRAMTALELNTRAVRSSAEVYRVAADLFQAGTATTTDIIDAEIARVTTTLQEFNARVELRVAELKLRYATGRLEPIEALTVDDRGRPIGAGARGE